MSTHLSAAKIGVTLGDPSGIGPEIVVRALAKLDRARLQQIVIFGDQAPFHLACLQVGSTPAVEIAAAAQTGLRESDLQFGHPSNATARAQVAYLEAAVVAIRSGEIAALATAPISKSEASRAGFAFPGHTEFLAAELGAERVAMMFAGPKLKVVLATVHEALATLPEVLTQARIESAIELAAHSLRRDFGIERPTIGVLGLNPHAGEAGRFGDEEARVIAPAIAAMRERLGDQVLLSGPLVPDAAFRMPLDCFVAMYHDQGLIPVKLVDFDESVNMTLGLPIVRTSPDHGVAYDIAGQGRARATSMSAAIALAFQLTESRGASAQPG